MAILPIVSCWTPETGIEELRKRLSAAYPFGERKYWPYKVWLSEVNRTIAAVERLEEHNRLVKQGLFDSPIEPR
jgi:hypothetical protein